VALRLFRRADSSKELPSSPAGPVPWLLGATGLLGIGYEIVVIRALSQVAENTVYTFAVLLAV
jgi:spermidine synthase